ncbi:MAG: sigma-70 family RNA polymerase sigma factor [Phycisphaerae bacterium]|nr:sigma-70 family RNA polymerase sigma factor [Phycisphaerae bacterium]
METTQTNLLWAVRDAANGDAWISFYRIYATMVRQFVRRLGLPDAESDDVTQEVLLVAHKSLQHGTYDPTKGRFRSWLFGVARRQSLAAMRERQRRTRVQRVTQDTGDDLLDILADKHAEETARNLWEREWRYALLEEALRHAEAGIGTKAMQAFTLHAIQNQSAECVAEQLGITPASVYVYKGRVLAAIQEWTRRFEGD